jgi:hypothetical protein
VARWLLVALYVNAILWTIPLQRPFGQALRGLPLGNLGLAGVGTVFALAVLAWALRRSQSPAVVALGAAGYAGLVALLSPVPDEIVHLAEYGVLGMCLRGALGDRPRACWLAIGGTGAVGLLDEWIQGSTPGRFFDWRDVVANLVSGAIPVWLSGAARANLGRKGEEGWSVS